MAKFDTVEKTVSFTVWGITETEKSLWVIAATVKLMPSTAIEVQ